MSLKQNTIYEEHQQEIKEDNDYDLHEQAGLVYWGRNDEGEDEWVGSNAKWNKYSELINKLN